MSVSLFLDFFFPNGLGAGFSAGAGSERGRLQGRSRGWVQIYSGPPLVPASGLHDCAGSIAGVCWISAHPSVYNRRC